MADIKNICMFMGSRAPNPKHVLEAELLAENLAKTGHTLVWGGQASGIMGKIGDTWAKFKANDAEMIGITTKQIRSFCADMHPACTDIHVALDERERHHLYTQKADAYILLPGGLGSAAEGISILEQAYVDMHQHLNAQKPYTVKPFIFLNVNGYYTDLITQFLEMMGEFNDQNTYMDKKVANLYWPNKQTSVDHADVVTYLANAQQNPIVITHKI